MRTMGEIVLRGFICERCGHRWVSRENDKPKVCPGCKSATGITYKTKIQYQRKEEIEIIN
jgi:predicted Zn-ribbon and HTH transcriptional regulator